MSLKRMKIFKIGELLDETLALDAPLGCGVNANTTFGEPPPFKI